MSTGTLKQHDPKTVLGVFFGAVSKSLVRYTQVPKLGAGYIDLNHPTKVQFSRPRIRTEIDPNTTAKMILRPKINRHGDKLNSAEAVTTDTPENDIVAPNAHPISTA